MESADGPSITCPVCGRTSYHPIDIEQGYCGYCHDWTTPVSQWWVAAEGLVAHRLNGGGTGMALCGARAVSPWLPVDESLVPQCTRCLEFHHGSVGVRS